MLAPLTTSARSFEARDGLYIVAALSSLVLGPAGVLALATLVVSARAPVVREGQVLLALLALTVLSVLTASVATVLSAGATCLFLAVLWPLFVIGSVTLLVRFRRQA